ncbi:S-adenosyl-L-methionine-dependent methyltransferase [Phakopsora pachyrhizi]|uniref:S-adenosyl-L-methionine-dependent methyltransferase n=1 Tax=Phakopsora pachyrhizi TaxID=170000 RepID=A0AAV0BHD9_PHAPC|nr:S-adenosyl-L-methionine-dependent methyltransferase [Phakopsora pachyrhizi]CAH7686116.1 S-adenosyl-L-methionine-dependent methyltransferase [Phakopsora pachyrhizi]
MSVRHPIASSAFSASGASGLYEKSRPTYPTKAIFQILSCLPRNEVEVVEFGSGTGIFTRALLSSASPGQIKRLVAIEPAEGMRAGFEKSMKNWKELRINDVKRNNLDGLETVLPQIECCDGTFSDVGLSVKSASADLVVAAQAWHWTGKDISVHEKCMNEVFRLLKPGGYFALIWNLKDREFNEWVGKIRDCYEVYESGTPQYRLGYWKNLFKTNRFKSSFELISLSSSSVIDNRYTISTTKKSEHPNETKKDQDESSDRTVFKKNVDDSLDRSEPTLTIRRTDLISFEELYQRILSKSYITELDEESKVKLRSELESIWNEEVSKRQKENSDIQGKSFDEKYLSIEFPYVTHLYLMKKIDQ